MFLTVDAVDEDVKKARKKIWKREGFCLKC